MSKHWKLEKADVYLSDHPDLKSDFVIDSNELLQKGSKAKLVFVEGDQEAEKHSRELLWVEILLVQDDKLLGQVQDTPKILDNLTQGELVEFEEEHIIQFDYIDPFSPSIRV